MPCECVFARKPRCLSSSCTNSNPLHFHMMSHPPAQHPSQLTNAQAVRIMTRPENAEAVTMNISRGASHTGIFESGCPLVGWACYEHMEELLNPNVHAADDSTHWWWHKSTTPTSTLPTCSEIAELNRSNSVRAAETVHKDAIADAIKSRQLADHCGIAVVRLEVWRR